MKLKLSSVMVDNQDRALKFYTEVLGFVVSKDIPMGFPPARIYQQALFEAGIPATAFAVDDIQKEYERMKKLGVVFSQEPTKMGPVIQAVFEDTCGNLIQLYQV